MSELCNAIELDTNELTQLCREGKGNSARAMVLAKKIASNLEELKKGIETALVDKGMNLTLHQNSKRKKARKMRLFLRLLFKKV